MTNVLVLGDDKNLLDNAYSDVVARHKIYARELGKLFVCVPAYSSSKPKLLGDNLFVMPVLRKNLLIWYFSLYYIAKDICKKNKIDVITVQDPFFFGFVGVLLKKQFKIPLNVQIHSEFFVNKYWNSKIKNKIRNFLGYYVLKNADTIRTVNPRVFGFLSRFSARKYLVPIATSVKDFPLKKKYDSNTVLFVGRLNPEKNIQLLMNAMVVVQNKINDTKLTVVGDGPELNKLKRLARILNVKVEFVGFKKYEELKYFLHRSSCLVLPSFFEGWGLAAIETLSCGVPVIMTNTGCAGYIVKNGENGYVIPNNNSRILADKIIKLLLDINLQKKFGINGRKLVEAKLNGEKLRVEWVECLKETARLK